MKSLHFCKPNVTNISGALASMTVRAARRRLRIRVWLLADGVQEASGLLSC